MNQQKIGAFFKELRNEKNITQEQLAEKFGVSRRTVSRWETGSNMPDLDILIEMADYYDVDLRELIDGERKSEKMNQELEEIVKQMGDSGIEEKSKIFNQIFADYCEKLYGEKYLFDYNVKPKVNYLEIFLSYINGGGWLVANQIRNSKH